MTDSENFELLNLGINPDENSFAATNAEIDKLRGTIDRLSSSATAAFDDRNNNSHNYIKTLDEIRQKTFKAAVDTGDLSAQVTNLTRHYQEMGGVLPGLKNQLESVNDEIASMVAAEPAVTSGTSGNRSASTLPVIFGLQSGGRLAKQAGMETLGSGLDAGSQLLSVSQGLAALNPTITATGIAVSGLQVAWTPLLAVMGAGVVVAGALALAQQDYNNQLEQGKKLLDVALEADERWVKAQHTMTSNDAQQAIEDEFMRKRIANDKAGNARDAINRLMEQQQDALFLKGLPTQEDRDLSLRQRPEFEQLFKQLDEANGEFEKASHYITRLTQGLESNAFAVNDAREAAKKHTDELIRQAAETVNFENLSSKAAKDKIASLKDNIEANEKAVKILQDSGSTTAETKARIMELNEAIEADKWSVKNLRDEIMPLIEAREAEAAEIEYEKEQREKIAKLTEKFNAERESIEQKAADKEIEIHRKAADKVADIIQKEIDTRTAALQKLYIKEADLTDDYVQDSDKARRKAAFDDIQAQRKELVEEREQLVEHLKQVQEIQRRFQTEGYEALLDRDYIALTKLKARYQEESRTEEDRNSEAIREKQSQAVNERQALAAQREFEQNERRIAYENRIKEAQKQYEQELENARYAKMQALEIARQTEINEITLAQQGRDGLLEIARDKYKRELDLAMLSRDALLAQQAHTQALLVEQANRFMNVNASTETAGRSRGDTTADTYLNSMLPEFATGGSFGAGDPFTMSEYEPEMLNIGGAGYMVNNAAMVYPLQSGSVTHTSGDSKTTILAPVFNLNGISDVDEIKDKLLDMLETII